MFGKAWKIFSVGGVPVQVDASWVLIAALITYSFWWQTTTRHPTTSDTTTLAISLAAAALFFGSILLHEGAHAGMSRLQGIKVRSITLFLFGGVTSANVEEKGPGTEFLVAVVGPATSLALSGLFWVLGTAFAATPLVGDPLKYLAFVNLILAVFNIIPGYPLDGGRLLRSAVWGLTGKRGLAAKVAAWSGQLVGIALIAWGVLQFSRSGNFLGGIWSAYIGLFLIQAARQAEGQEKLRSMLEGALVRDAMSLPPAPVPASITLQQALDGYLRGHEDRIFPVVEGSRLVGLLTFPAAAAVGQHDPLRAVRDAMLPLDDVRTVQADEPLERAIPELQRGAALVLRGEELVGSISANDISRWAENRERAHASAAETPPRPDA